MGNAEHRIGRMVFEARGTDPRDLSAFHGHLRNRFESEILPALQTALDRVDVGARVIRLDRLQVDLGVVGHEFDDLAERITNALMAVLSDTMAAVVDMSTAGAEQELIRFLETGHLSWVEPENALVTLVRELLGWDSVAFQAMVSRIHVVLLRKSAAQRMVLQLPKAFVLQVLSVLAEEWIAPLALPKTIAPRPDVYFTPQQAVRVLPLLRKLLRGKRGDMPPEALYSEIVALVTEDHQQQQPRITPTDLGESDRPELQVSEKDTVAEPLAEPLFVYAAGAVLLHPFLGSFFDQLGLLDATGQFSDKPAQIRAVLAAHHLATGALQASEPELTVFKLLCGLPLTHPVPRQTPVWTRELAESADLLHSVIGHWNRLGKTSPDGLRDGFLTRSGKLQETETGWLLTVERRSMDILLDYLPWAISQIKTPFMTRLLTVDWR